MPRTDDWGQLHTYVLTAREEVAKALLLGRWETEAKARELAGKYNALTDVLNEMAHSDETGKDL